MSLVGASAWRVNALIAALFLIPYALNSDDWSANTWARLFYLSAITNIVLYGLRSAEKG